MGAFVFPGELVFPDELVLPEAFVLPEVLVLPGAFFLKGFLAGEAGVWLADLPGVRGGRDLLMWLREAAIAED
jgi:hypothetical protein